MSYSEIQLAPVEWATLLRGRPSFLKWRRVRGAKLSGLAYERRAQEYLHKRYNGMYLAAPWICYKLKGEKQFRFCQPDGLFFNFQQLYIGVIEIKLKHTAEAYWQVNNLYVPILEKVFAPIWKFRTLEMCRWFDGVDYFPCEPVMVDDLELFPRKGFGVHVWRP